MSSSETPQTVEATVRHVPRYGVFMGIGVVLGVIAAGILTFTGSFEESQALDVVYPPGQVFGFLLLWTVPIGIALGGVVALILERTGRRHDRVVRVDRETIIEIHDEAPEAQAAPEAAASDAPAPERD
ncbi:potassium transporter Trk [Microbacterium sp. 22179]|uniref:potassium transporter Trk n=1 Tax=Microbacterium sp. 22179 TaxID=3453886 RepID=UPI003F83F5FA